MNHVTIMNPDDPDDSMPIYDGPADMIATHLAPGVYVDTTGHTHPVAAEAMTNAELIELLQQHNPEAEVRLAVQPSWPLQFHVADVVALDDDVVYVVSQDDHSTRPPTAVFDHQDDQDDPGAAATGWGAEPPMGQVTPHDDERR